LIVILVELAVSNVICLDGENDCYNSIPHAVFAQRLSPIDGTTMLISAAKIEVVVLCARRILVWIVFT